MPRLRVRRLPAGTHELLLHLTNRHIHAQLVDRVAGRVIIAAHSNEQVRAVYTSRSPSFSYSKSRLCQALAFESTSPMPKLDTDVTRHEKK
jgi:ribosomal protein L18